MARPRKLTPQERNVVERVLVVVRRAMRTRRDAECHVAPSTFRPTVFLDGAGQWTSYDLHDGEVPRALVLEQLRRRAKKGNVLSIGIEVAGPKLVAIHFATLTRARGRR